MVELTYKITAADRHPLPKAYFVEQRLIGYDQRERNLPFASFFQDKVRAIQPHAAAALSAGIGSAKEAYDVRDVASRLSAPGYEAFENGWRARR